MTLIKVPTVYALENTPSQLIKFYRENPIVAASHLLRRDGQPLYLAPIQQIVITEWWQSRFSILTASRGYGKLQDLNSKILTDKGWVRMGDIQLGDSVITPKGTKASVMEIHPHGKQDIYKLTFQDGRTAYAGLPHLWKCIGVSGYGSKSNEWQLRTTQELKEFLDTKAKNQHQSIRISLVEDSFITESDKELPIHPYILGRSLSLKNSIIPEEFLNLSREQSLELIKGLFDANKKHKLNSLCYDFSVLMPNKIIARQTQQLVWKLGGCCFLHNKHKNNNFSKLSIKLSKNSGLRVLSIEKYSNEDSQCITISDPEGLYVIEDYVVTHNSFSAAVYIALQCMLYPGKRAGIFAPAFRQSKLLFKEFERLYNESPMLQECISRAPSYLNDHCICEFKSPGKGMMGSYVKALPVGSDGGKIRGERLSCIIIDEIAQLPQTVFRSSIQPMLSTASNPMLRVKQIEEERARNNGEIITTNNLSTNGYIGITSGYYQFNYWWEQICSFYENIRTGKPGYNLRFVPYTELPEGFLDMAIVEDARDNSPSHVFMTEWMAAWVADSEGAFPMSLLESVRDPSIVPKSGRDLNEDKGKEYVFGIDVARERDSTAIVVVEIGYPSKVVHLVELEQMPFPQQSRTILNLVRAFNPIMIYMDEFGGGKDLKDHFADPETLGFSASEKIISVDESLSFSGKRILKTCVPNPAFIEDANNNTKTLLEQKMIKLPHNNNPIEVSRNTAKGQKKTLDLVQEMINQIASVVITGTAGGRLHYDLPRLKSKSMYNAKKKDLYSAFVLACKCVYDLKWQPKSDRNLVQTGVVKEIGSNLTLDSNSNMISGDRVAGTISPIDNSASGSNRTIIPGGGIIISKHVRQRR